jgi:hypothetical protein
MSEITLTQAEADALIALEKYSATDQTFDYPGLGGSICVPYVSADKRENFLLNVSRGRIDLQKGTYQTRARQIVVLVRLDFGGPPHRNPDDVEVPSPHLHIYQEGFGDKWAYPISAEQFPDTSDLWQTLQDFARYCNIKTTQNILQGVFS